MNMKILRVGRFSVIALAVFAFMAGTASDANAQTRRELERERQRIERQNERLQRQRDRQRRSRYDDDRRYNRGSSRAASNAAILQGYQQGLMAGQSDRRARKYNRFNVYRSSGSAPNSGDPTSWDYLYRQGYLEGYEDGYHGRRRY
jgi:hypothetical protein